MRRSIYTFALTVTIFLIASFVPYFLTADAPAYDGQQIMGFPLPFRSYGGLCPEGVCKSFSAINLVLDFLLAHIVALGISFIIKRKVSLDSISQVQK